MWGNTKLTYGHACGMRTEFKFILFIYLTMLM